MALELASQGVDLILHGSTSSRSLETCREDALAEGAATVTTLTFDVSDSSACEKALADIGTVDVVINNAGRSLRLISETFNTVPTKFWETRPEAWDHIIATNLNGPFHVSRCVVPGMVERGYGKIINISTSDITMVRRGYAPYGPSKAGLEAASRIWAQDLEGTGVTVNVFLPGGAADTDLLPPSPNKRGADGNLLPASIMRRGIRWLCGPESDGVTGARFIARLWDNDCPDDEAAEKARSLTVERPAIM
ncbi:SDR family oxidoreductase (plasmid) [Thioclava sp. 'Guangxiensis']|uniref:SDR family NAD(P)-dependent oxidoreductase n=1 Tax=Thioclava sp. 'Guangxiensis' TaxID=3149044 RepID=UPI0032C40B9C